MSTRTRWTKTALLFGGTAAWGLLLISCVVANRTMLAPPFIAGANFAGTKECGQCHEEQTAKFASATHAKLAFAEGAVGATGCEACHGPASLHVKAGGSKGTIINPKKSPEASGWTPPRRSPSTSRCAARTASSPAAATPTT